LDLSAIKLFYFSINLLVEALGDLDCSFQDSFLVAQVAHYALGSSEFRFRSLSVKLCCSNFVLNLSGRTLRNLCLVVSI